MTWPVFQSLLVTPFGSYFDHYLFGNFWTPLKSNISDFWNWKCWTFFGSEIEVSGEGHGPHGYAPEISYSIVSVYLKRAYLKNEQCYIVKSPVYHFYVKKDISEDFRICISVRLREPPFGTLLGICFCNALLLSLSMFFSYSKRFFFLLLLEDMSTANNKKIRNIFIFNMFIFTKCWF